MPKKSRKKGRSNKWSRANILNYVAGGILALSMILGSFFVFGGAPTPQAQTAPTPIVETLTPTAQPVMQNATDTPALTTTPVSPGPAATPSP